LSFIPYLDRRNFETIRIYARRAIADHLFVAADPATGCENPIHDRPPQERLRRARFPLFLAGDQAGHARPFVYRFSPWLARHPVHGAGGDSPPSHGGVDERTGTRRESSPEAPMASPIQAASVGSQNSWRSSARIRYAFRRGNYKWFFGKRNVDGIWRRKYHRHQQL